MKLKKLAIPLSLLILVSNVYASDKLKTRLEKTSYAVGVNYGYSINDILKENIELGIFLKKKIIIEGINDSIDGKLILSENEIEQLLNELDDMISITMDEKMAVQSSRNEIIGKKFTQNYLKGKNVKTTQSGLIYKPIKLGSGNKVIGNEFIDIIINGKFINGYEFINEENTIQPQRIVINELIPGLKEGVNLMNVGDIYEFLIPPNLAYDDEANMFSIPENAYTIFKVEAVGISN